MRDPFKSLATFVRKVERSYLHKGGTQEDFNRINVWQISRLYGDHWKATEVADYLLKYPDYA